MPRSAHRRTSSSSSSAAAAAPMFHLASSRPRRASPAAGNKQAHARRSGPAAGSLRPEEGRSGVRLAPPSSRACIAASAGRTGLLQSIWVSTTVSRSAAAGSTRGEASAAACGGPAGPTRICRSFKTPRLGRRLQPAPHPGGCLVVTLPVAPEQDVWGGGAVRPPLVGLGRGRHVRRHASHRRAECRRSGARRRARRCRRRARERPELVGEAPQVGDACIDILPGVEGVRDAEVVLRAGHQLHQALRSGPRLRARAVP